MKKIVALVLALLMVLLITPVVHAAGVVGKIDVTLSTTEVIQPGEKVTVTISLIDCIPGLAGYNYTLKFNPKLVTAGTPDTSGVPQSLSPITFVNNEKGEIGFAAAQATGLAEKLTCNLAVIEFTAKETARGVAEFYMSRNNLTIIESDEIMDTQATGNWVTTKKVQIGDTLLGDVNRDGYVNIIDVQRLYAHLNGSNPLTDAEELAIADVNIDGNINIVDVQRLYAHLNGSNPLQ